MFNAIPTRLAAVLAAGLVLFFLSTAGVAHHPMGESVPVTLWQGFFSGIGHPVIGLDHLAFIVALGLLAAWQPRCGRWLLLSFLPATVVGTLFTLGGLALPFVELGVAVSVVLIGAALFAGRAGGHATLVLFAAMSGAFHGLAYGESIVGAEPTPIVAYLSGFFIIQSLIAIAVMHLVRALPSGVQSEQFVGSRVTGAIVGMAGTVFVVRELLV